MVHQGPVRDRAPWLEESAYLIVCRLVESGAVTDVESCLDEVSEARSSVLVSSDKVSILCSMVSVQ